MSLDSLRQSGRIQAFLIHLGISAAVVGLVALLMISLWYPQPWFSHDGGWQVFRLILLVDVVLGPTLTLIVYRRGKPELRRDLAIIGGVQLTALLYGALVMFLYRPAFIVYADNNFFAVPARDMQANTTDLARLAPLRPARGPGFVFLRLPGDAAQRRAILEAQRLGGPAIITLGDRYEAMTPPTWQQVFATGVNVEQFAAGDPAIKAELERFRAAHPQPLQSLAFVPVVCRYGVILLAFDRQSTALVGWLN